MSGTVWSREGVIPFRGFRTWYRVVGHLARPAAGTIPLLVLHGGPGVPHDYLEPLEALAQTGRPVVLYDQLGCGNSERLNDPSLWRVGFFVDELAAVCHALGLDRVHLFGHSWGGMLALEYALSQPRRIASLILASSLATNLTHAADRARVYDGLPAEVRDTLRAHEAAGTTDAPAYQEARRIFKLRHVCRIEPEPECLRRAVERRNPQGGRIMWESGEVRGGIGLRSWDITGHLGEIHVPTLVTAGHYDGLVPGQDKVLRDGIRGSERVLFEESAHYPHLEESERYLSVLRSFLTRVEN